MIQLDKSPRCLPLAATLVMLYNVQCPLGHISNSAIFSSNAGSCFNLSTEKKDKEKKKRGDFQTAKQWTVKAFYTISTNFLWFMNGYKQKSNKIKINGMQHSKIPKNF